MTHGMTLDLRDRLCASPHVHKGYGYMDLPS
jgi:hypothetical protein